MALVLDGSANTIAGLAVGGLPDGSVDADTLASGTRGLQIADSWRINADITGTGDITSGWERDDTEGNGLLGTGMTESSGVFTFPATGYWLVFCTVQFRFPNTAVRWTAHHVKYTADNGSNWSNATRGITCLYATGNSNATHNDTHSEKLFDITDTSQQKIKVTTTGDESNIVVQGNTSDNETGLRFLKIGDT